MIRPLDKTNERELTSVQDLVKAAQRVQHVELESRDTPAESDTNAAEAWLMNLSDPSVNYFVYDDEVIKGYILLRDIGDQTALIDDLGVGAPYQRQGIGGKLVRYVITWATDEGYISVKLITHTDNVSAAATYRGAGFDETPGNFLGFEKRL